MVSRGPVLLGRRGGLKASKSGNLFSISVALIALIGLSLIWWTLGYTSSASSHIHKERVLKAESWHQSNQDDSNFASQIKQLAANGNSDSDTIYVGQENTAYNAVQAIANLSGDATNGVIADVASVQGQVTNTSAPKLPSLPKSIANIKAERPDASCQSLVSSASGQDAAKSLFDCRMQAARQLADAACTNVDIESQYEKQTLNIGAYLLGMGLPVPPEKYTTKMPIAIQQEADIISNSIRSSGVWSVAEVRTILRALYAVNATDTATESDPPILMDIGANLGVFTFVAASLGFRVYAFEALSSNVERLHQTLCWNPHLKDLVTVIPMGLTDADQDCLIISDSTLNIGDGHTVCTDEQLNEYRVKEGFFHEGDSVYIPHGAVHTVRLADYFAGGPRADVVVLDVEGYEPQVLAGAGEVLDHVKYMLTEINPADMGKKTSNGFEATATDYLLHWESRGFELHMCSNTACFETIETTPENIVDYCVAADGAIVIVLMVAPSQQGKQA